MSSGASATGPGGAEVRSAGTAGATRRDLGVALAVFCAAVLLFGLTLQRRFIGDGCWIVEFLYSPIHDRIPTHPLYWAVQWLVEALTPQASIIARTKGTSVVAAALGCAFTFLVCRRLGVGRTAALAGTALVAASPAHWFFATTVEYHALHFGTVAALALLTLSLRWRRPAWSVAVLAPALCVGFASHQIFLLLVPGWILLVQLARRRANGRGFSPQGLVAGVALPVGAALLATQFAVESWNAGEPSLGFQRERVIVDAYTHGAEPLRMLWSGWALGLGLLAPIAFLGVFARFESAPPPGRRADPRPALLTLVLVPLVVFLFLYPLPERGGFFLGSAPFAAVLAAMGVQRFGERPKGWVAAAVAAQAAVGLFSVRSFDSRYDPAERAARVRAVLEDGGVLLSADYLAPNIAIYLPDVSEVKLHELIDRSAEDGVPPEQFADLIVADLIARWPERPAAFDQSYRFFEDRSDFVFGQGESRVRRANRTYLRALEEAVRESFETRLFEDESWPLLRLERPRS